MKKNKFMHGTAALLLTLSTWLAAAATPAPKMIVRIAPGESVRSIDVQLANLQQQRTQIAIQDVNGKLWYSEFCEKEDGYAKRLNLGGMPEGHYICFVKNRRGQSAQAFRLSAGGLSFFEKPAASNVGPDLRVYTGAARPCLVRIGNDGARSLQLQLANLQQQNLRVRLNALGEGVAFEQKIQGESGYAQKIDLNDMPAGTYFLYVKVGNADLIQHLGLGTDGIELGPLEILDQSGQTRPAMVKNDNPG